MSACWSDSAVYKFHGINHYKDLLLQFLPVLRDGVSIHIAKELQVWLTRQCCKTTCHGDGTKQSACWCHLLAWNAQVTRKKLWRSKTLIMYKTVTVQTIVISTWVTSMPRLCWHWHHWVGQGLNQRLMTGVHCGLCCQIVLGALQPPSPWTMRWPQHQTPPHHQSHQAAWLHLCWNPAVARPIRGRSGRSNRLLMSS